MDSLILFVFAMVLSMTIVPLMIRIAPKVGMIDLPDPRKVHKTPIARVGGVGIVIGSLVPILFWFQFEPLIISYIFGSVVLLVFGVWDDSCELGHYVKFVGQFLAVIPAVYFADVYVSVLPVVGEIPESLGKVFTVIAIVGMINAINHSDGLDGLAGGMSMLSLACIGYFMYMADDLWMTFLVVSVMGGVFGFLRFNSHPAKVFMGDGGSQFLGFTLGFLAVVLTQKSNPALSPALPILMLGLPIVDILAVFYLRISGGMNWFKATRNHIHHRLLDLGFTHYESVIVIYLIQMFLVLSSFVLMYEYDWVIISLYLAVTIVIFTVLTTLERKGFKISRADNSSVIDTFIKNQLKGQIISKLLVGYIVLSIPAIFLSVSMFSSSIATDIAYLSLMLVVFSVFSFFAMKTQYRVVVKLMLYVTAALIVYLDYSTLQPNIDYLSDIEVFIYALLALAIIFIIKFDEKVDFELSPMDYLVAIIVLVAFLVFNFSPGNIEYGNYLLKIILIFYGCELIEKRSSRGFNLITVSALLALIIIMYRVAFN